MANLKISALTALAVAPATNDLVPIVDVSDSTDAATGTTKKITVANLFTAPTIADFTNMAHDHGDADNGGQLTDAALSSAVGIAKGGTGQTTNTAAFDALAPTTTAGDTMYHNGSDNIRLAKGTAGQSLVMNSGATAPEWGGAGTNHLVGALENSIVKTYFNIQLPFMLWAGASDGAVDTQFDNWIRSSTDVVVTPNGSQIYFINTGSDNIHLRSIFNPAGTATLLQFTDSHIIILDFWMKYISGTGQAIMGFFDDSAAQELYTQNGTGAGFHIDNGVLYALTKKADPNGQDVRTDISSGLTITNWNSYRIEFDMGADTVRFYVNGTLKQTSTGAGGAGDSIPTAGEVYIAFGRNTTNPPLYSVMAPNLSIEMNP